MPRSFLVKKKPEKATRNAIHDSKPKGRQLDLEQEALPDSSFITRSVLENARIQPWIDFKTSYFYPAEVTAYHVFDGHVFTTQSSPKYEEAPAALVSAESPQNDRSISREKSRTIKKHRCQDCERSFNTLTALRKHQHPRKEFACKYCEKTYVSLGALKMHIRTHTLPCKCTICGKAFSRPWLLQGHIRTHTGEKPYKCPSCDRAFADRSNLRAHLQTHSAVKKYSCSQCSRSFSRMSLLLKHQYSCRDELNLSWNFLRIQRLKTFCPQDVSEFFSPEMLVFASRSCWGTNIIADRLITHNMWSDRSKNFVTEDFLSFTFLLLIGQNRSNLTEEPWAKCKEKQVSLIKTRAAFLIDLSKKIIEIKLSFGT